MRQTSLGFGPVHPHPSPFPMQANPSPSIPPQISGGVALVTGANSGLGYETARALAERGMHVIVAGRNEKRVHAAVERLEDAGAQGQVEVGIVDLTSLSAVQKFARDIVERHVRLSPGIPSHI